MKRGANFRKNGSFPHEKISEILPLHSGIIVVLSKSHYDHILS